ncbi:MAG: rRNA pseudouridine synthase [Clostridia bacterium]|nr:rRNA pseudouridine synthase [Clostridia bacterium]
MRIDKFISECGLASRKETALAAKRGLLLVDGVAERDVSRHIDPELQRVTFMGREVLYRKYTYVMLNKPEGYVSATDDKKLPYVTELLPPELRKMELFPVGRLDRDTVGLMILTNDGVTAHTLLSPKRHVSKTYKFECVEPLPQNAEDTFSAGITLADGYECKSAVLVCNPDRLGGYITLTEGKYHQIKRMVASFHNRVSYLERVTFADIPLDTSLARGEWRYLTDVEIGILLSKAK